MKKKKAIAKIMLKCIIVKLIIIIKKIKNKNSKGRALVSINSPRDNPHLETFYKAFFQTPGLKCP